MTQLKLIDREPTEEMLDDGAACIVLHGGVVTVKSVFQSMFDAAPHIETEADKAEKKQIKAMELYIEAADLGMAIGVKYAETQAQVKMLVEALRSVRNGLHCGHAPTDMLDEIDDAIAKIKEESASSPTPDANTDSQ